jgi:hypothetical protein
MIKIKTIKLLLPLLFFLLFLRPVKAQTIIPCGTPGIKKCTTTETGQPAYAVCAADGITGNDMLVQQEEFAYLAIPVVLIPVSTQRQLWVQSTLPQE